MGGAFARGDGGDRKLYWPHPVQRDTLYRTTSAERRETSLIASPLSPVVETPVVKYQHAEKPVLAVIGGSGAEGSGLAVRWAKAGYRVLLGSRGIDKAVAKADELNALLGYSAIKGMANEDAAKQADIAILTVPYVAQLSTFEI